MQLFFIIMLIQTHLNVCQPGSLWSTSSSTSLHTTVHDMDCKSLHLPSDMTKRLQLPSPCCLQQRLIRTTFNSGPPFDFNISDFLLPRDPKQSAKAAELESRYWFAMRSMLSANLRLVISLPATLTVPEKFSYVKQVVKQAKGQDTALSHTNSSLKPLNIVIFYHHSIPVVVVK